MTGDLGNIGKYIKDIAGSGTKPYSVLGYASNINEKKMICDVVAADKSITYFNVRLKEITEEGKEENGFWIIPKDGSRVIIDCLSPAEAYVSMLSEVDKVHYRVKDLRVGLSEMGFSIDNGSEDFKSLMDDLIDVLSKLQVQTAWGPSGVPMQPTLDGLDKFKTSLAKLLTEGSKNAAK
jgi:hypothetical protein